MLLLCAFGLLLSIGFLIDWFGATSLSERAKVINQEFIPSHLEWQGNRRVRVPDRWRLHVENSDGHGVVAVPKALYENIAQGETIQVSGTRGSITKRWYLNEASKGD